jgi:hypothetical protein
MSDSEKKSLIKKQQHTLKLLFIDVYRIKLYVKRKETKINCVNMTFS